MTVYPRIPDPPDQGDLPADHYGRLLLQFVMVTDVTVTLSLSQLELAEYAAARVVGLPFDPATADHVRREIDRARSLISGAIRRARQLQSPAATIAGEVTPDKPNLGPMARLQDAPIVRPPSGGYAEIVAPDRKYDNVQF